MSASFNKKPSGSKQTVPARFTALMKNCPPGQTITCVRTFELVKYEDDKSFIIFSF
jgi:hypothetical protein